MNRETTINYYVREEDLDKEFLEGLRVRKIDEKFKYVGERQANAWFNLCNSPEYDYYRNSKKLLKDTIKDFVSDNNANVNVIALGPGNALKEKIVVEALQERHQADLFFVDISRQVISIAVENVADSNVLREVFIADLMNFKDIARLSRHARKQYNATSLFTLLGNTLGNYPQPVILKTLRSAMVPGDKILIDVLCETSGSIEKASKIVKRAKEYDNPTHRERLQALLLDVDIEETDLTVELESSMDKLFPRMNVIEQYFRFNRSKIINYRGEDIYFAEGERILGGYSNKYTFEVLENIFTSHGLRIVREIQDDTGKIYQLLCELA